MIGLQRRLRLVFAQVLVQIGVHAFVVILRRVIHVERMTSSELDVVEMEFSGITIWFLRFAMSMRNLYLHWNRWMMKAPLLVNVPPFLRPNHPRRVSQFHLSKSTMTVCGCFFVKFHDEALLFFGQRLLQCPFDGLFFSSFMFIAKKLSSASYRFEWALRKNRLKQLICEMSELLIFLSFFGFRLQRTLQRRARVCVWLCKTVFSFFLCFTFNHKMQLMHRFVCFLDNSR